MNKLTLLLLIVAAAGVTVRAFDDEDISYDLEGGDIDYEEEEEPQYTDNELQEMGLWDDEKDRCVPWYCRPPSKPRPPKPAPAPDRSICKKPGGYYQDTSNCRCFYQCDLAFRPYRKCCKKGQAFSQKNLVCAEKKLVTCGDNPNPSYDCPRGNGTFPHRDCTKFWHCSNWLPYEKDCPAGLHWDRCRRRCEWPHIARCKPGWGPRPTPRPTRPEPTRTRPTRPEPTRPRPTRPSCPRPKPCPTRAPCDVCRPCPDVICPSCPVCPTPAPKPDPKPCDLKRICRGCKEKRLKPHPDSRRKYIECNGGKNNKVHSIRRCSYGLLFNDNRLTCDYALFTATNEKKETLEDKLREEEEPTGIKNDLLEEVIDDDEQENEIQENL